jgi:hypothetical protein
MDCILSKGLVFVVMNSVYFGCIFVAALVGQFLYIPPPYMGEPVGVSGSFLGFDWPLMILSIFLFNLVLSGFVFVTLPGLVFFPFSAAALVMRAVLLGIMLNHVPTPIFLAAFPTLILEGEAYVLAGVAGVDLGLSWLKPKWAHGEEGLFRLESFKKVLKDCICIYVLVATLLFAAAVVETVTLIYFYNPELLDRKFDIWTWIKMNL